MLDTLLVVDWILLSKSTFDDFLFYDLYSKKCLLSLSRLDLTTEKVNSLGMHDDSISSMTFVPSTSKNYYFLKHLQLY